MTTLFIAITPHRDLTLQDLEHYSALAADIDGLILRTPMQREQLEQWIEGLLRHDFPKYKLIAHHDLQLLERQHLSAIHFKESAEELESFIETHPNIRVSQSTHSAATIQQAANLGLNFVLYGHIFPTKSKPGLAPRTAEEIREAVVQPIPVVALGGIALTNISQLPKGFAGIAAISLFENVTTSEIKALRKEWSDYV
ncbi:thiamine phosphate synthase [Staphylococcus argensis]|nr:thiamine phosphate synthase [Staphylococcus argensis]